MQFSALDPLLRVVRPPDGAAERTRWLFLLLCLLSLALSFPLMITAGPRAALVMGLSGLVLIASWTRGYIKGRTSPTLDVADALAIAATFVVSPVPPATFALLFGTLWLRSQYGPAWWAVARCVVISAAVVGAVIAQTRLTGQPAALPPAEMAPALPTMILTVLIGRYLGAVSQSAELSGRRAAALAALGPQLLGVADPDMIRRRTWTAVKEICLATPGMSVLLIVADTEGWRVVANAGALEHVPAVLPASSVLPLVPDPATSPVPDTPMLERVTAGPGPWRCLPVDDQLLLMRAPRREVSAGLTAMQSLAHLMTLALASCTAHHKLTVLARTDGLTGLLNRSAFTEELAAAMASDGDQSVAVLFVDLDGFKDINDVFGHRGGDRVLIEAATRLRRATRPDDVCARLGGDEFAVLLHEVTAETADEIARRVAGAFTTPVPMGDGTALIGASVGLATSFPGGDVEELLHEADLAMYAAKAVTKGSASSVR